MNEHDTEQVNIAKLSADQRELLGTYLRGAEIAHEINETTVTVPEDRARDLYSALTIVANTARGQRTDGHADPNAESDEEAGTEWDPDDDTVFDDEASSTTRPPLIRAPVLIADGRAVASRSRRLTGAMIDWLILDLWAFAAHAAGAPHWAVVLTLGVYVVAAIAVFGRTIGKWAVGTIVVANRNGDSAGWLRSAVRWLIVSWFSVVSVALTGLPGVVEVAAFAVLVLTYAPIAWDRHGRGLHDRAADTVVLVARR